MVQGGALVEAGPFHDRLRQSPQSRGKDLQGPYRRWMGMLGRFETTRFSMGEDSLKYDPRMIIAIL